MNKAAVIGIVIAIIVVVIAVGISMNLFDYTDSVSDKIVIEGSSGEANEGRNLGVEFDESIGLESP